MPVRRDDKPRGTDAHDAAGGRCRLRRTDGIPRPGSGQGGERAGGRDGEERAQGGQRWGPCAHPDESKVGPCCGGSCDCCRAGGAGTGASGAGAAERSGGSSPEGATGVGSGATTSVWAAGVGEGRGTCSAGSAGTERRRAGSDTTGEDGAPTGACRTGIRGCSSRTGEATRAANATVKLTAAIAATPPASERIIRGDMARGVGRRDRRSDPRGGGG